MRNTAVNLSTALSRFFAALCLLLTVGPLANAYTNQTSLQAKNNQPEGAVTGDTIISLVNVYPGQEIYQLEGHTMLRIQTPDTDVAVNYGMFSFNEPGFVYRFVKGETDYFVAAYPWDIALSEYRGTNRRIVQHTLNLTATQKQKLINLLNANLKPENATYRYNYVLDNCATRPLAIIEQATGKKLTIPQPPESINAQTFRSVMRQYHENYPWYQFGIDLALGSGIDYSITPRQSTFAPIVLDRLMPHITVAGQHLVTSTTIIEDYPEQAGILPSTPWYATPLTLSLAILAITIILAWQSIIRQRTPRLWISLIFTIMGLAGCLIWFLVFISEHEATAPNILMLWLNPALLCVPVLVWFKGLGKTITLYLMAAETLAIIIMLILWPITGQHFNAAFIPLIAATLLLTIPYIIRNRPLKSSAK